MDLKTKAGTFPDTNNEDENHEKAFSNQQFIGEEISKETPTNPDLIILEKMQETEFDVHKCTRTQACIIL